MSRKQYDETNRGALFINDRKESDSHPDLSGKINVDGKDYWLSGWTKRGEDGKFKLLSLSVKPKEANRDQRARKESFPEQRGSGRQDSGFRDDDDLGF